MSDHDQTHDDDGQHPPPRTGPRPPRPSNVDNVDNVDTGQGTQTPRTQPKAAMAPGRPRPFGQPGHVLAIRPFGGRPGRPAPRPNVDNVDTEAGGPAAQHRPVDGGDLADSLRELDRLDALGQLASGEAPREAPAGAIAAAAGSPTPTRLIEPSAPSRTAPTAGPGGPSRDALEAVRRAAKAKLGARAEAEGVAPGLGSQPSRVSASDNARPGTTASQATLDQYLRRGQQLFDRYRRELNLQISAEEASPIEWVNWLLSLEPTLSAATVRMYRQAAVHFLEGFPSHETEEALALLEAHAIERSQNPAPRPRTAEKRTSALKEKRFPLPDFEKVTTYLRAFNRSKLAPILLDWLRAGVLTGLRPVEWRATDLEIREDETAPHGRRAWLYVLNAKATNGRGTGVVRTLDISAFSDADIQCVERMVERGRRWLEEGRFGEMQSDCSSLLYAATARIFPGRRYAYALYSCRHQAIANWKAVLPLDEIAALVGHGITRTAAEHYGKRRSSWPPEQIPATPKPVPEELSQVRHRIRLFDARIKLEQAAGLRREGDTPQYPVG